jgi:putative membrane protein
VALAAVVLLPLAFAGLVVAAVSQADDGIHLIPAAIVDNDEMVTVTQPDGTQQQTLAGRLLVTNLTGPDSPGFDWTITNTADAKAMLAAGEVYAVVEVPSDFSASVVSLSSQTPVQAQIEIRTDDAHDYLVGSLAQVVGESMVTAFGEPITEQYISGLYGTISSLGQALSNAAGGATSLADGAASLSDGASQTAAGARSLSGGATELAGGVDEYTAGVSALTSGVSGYVAGVDQAVAGLQSIPQQLGPLDAAGLGVTPYTDSVAALAAEATAVAGSVPELDPEDSNFERDRVVLERIRALAARAEAVAAARTELLASVDARLAAANAAVSGAVGTAAASLNQLVVAGNELDAGGSALAASGPPLVSGAGGVATGAAALSNGAAQVDEGAVQLTAGAQQLASGLTDGAAQVPVFSDDQVTTAATVASTPVTLSVDRNNEVSDIGQILATFFVPLGLWIGALAVFLLVSPVSRSVLASTASPGRIALFTIGRAFSVTAVQAVLLVLLLHLALGVRWSVFPSTALFSLLIALSFTALHYLLAVAFPRVGPLVSLFLLAVQITATGSFYPIEVLAPVFRDISPFLPLTHAVNGLHLLIAGGPVGSLIGAVLYLVALTLLSTLGSLLALQHLRRARFAALVPSSP